MAEREFNPDPERLTDVLAPDVVRVLATGYCTLTRSPISIMERAGGAPVYTDPRLFRNPVYKWADENAKDECDKCDWRHVQQVLEGRIKRTTPYLCQFGQVDVVVPVRIGARTVAAFFGGQVPFHYWPRETQKGLIAHAIREDVLRREPEDAADAGRAAMLKTIEDLQIRDEVDVDGLMQAADEYMREQHRETDMEKYLELLEQTAAIIQNLGNEKYCADLLPYLSSLVQGEGIPADSDRAEDELWDGALRALGVVRRVMGFESGVVFANSEDAPSKFEITKAIGFPETKQRHIEKHKGALGVDAALLEQAIVASGSSARRDVTQRVRKWFAGPGVDPMAVTPVELDRDLRRFALMVVFGTDTVAEGIEHPAEREELWLDRVLKHMGQSIERRFVTIALRRRTEVQESFVMDLTHELKAPFQSILAQAQRLVRLIRSGRSPGRGITEAERRLSAERREVETRMASVSLLGARDASELNKRPHRVEGVIRDSVARYREIAAEREIRLRSSTGGDEDSLCFVNIDAESFELAIDNLLQNALKYSYPGTEVQVESANTSTSAVLRVTNVGARIPPEKRDDIFKKFVRLSPKETQFDFRPGTGIGLALVHTVVVVLHGGKVSVESAEAPRSMWPLNHNGAPPWRTRFTVELPRYQP